VAVGNLTSAGNADVIVSTQSSGNRFALYPGTALASGSTTPLFSQAAWSTPDNSGLSVATTPDPSDSLDDLLVANGSGSKVAIYSNSLLMPTGWATSSAGFQTDPIGGVATPINVG
jgi:hypothetical protein